MSNTFTFTPFQSNLQAWIIGSITLLIVRSDEKTSLYRETLHVLHKYSTLHNFDKKLTKRLRNQLKLDFDNKDIGDEQGMVC